MNDQPTPRLVSLRCQHCDAHIEFDASECQPGDNAIVNCPHCQMDTSIFVPALTPENAAPKNIGLTPRTKFLLLGALAVLAISGLLLYLIKTDKMTPTFLWQTLITLVFCGLGGFLYWRFPSKKYFFAEPVISYIEKGDLFSRMFSFLLRFCGVIVGVVAFVFWFQFWPNVFKWEKLQIAGGVLYQIIVLIGVYATVHIYWIRAKSIANLGKSDFTIIPVMAILLKMNGETNACFFSLSGLALGVLCLFGVDSSFISNSPFWTPYKFWISDSFTANGNLLPALGMIGFGIAIGILFLVLFYVASEILLVVFDIARNTRAIRDHLTETGKLKSK
jgi:hypothetical protein